MTQRERNLAIAVVVLIVGWGGWLGLQWWSDAVERRVRDRDDARIALAAAQLREDKTRAAARRLEDLRARSLPADVESAQAVYRDWLVSSLEASGITLESIRPLGVPVDRGGAYTALPFDVQGTGDAGAVTRFLHAFYSSPATHKITQLKLSPDFKAETLRIDLDAEAIVVQGTPNREGMPDGESDRLALADRQEYLDSIVARDLFQRYQPPPPPAPPRPRAVAEKPKPPAAPPFDDSKHAHFTGAVGAGSRLQAWVVVRTKGERLSLSAGDELSVGLLEGRVVDVLPRKLIYEADGQSYAVPLGASLRDGKPIDDAGLL